MGVIGRAFLTIWFGEIEGKKYTAFAALLAGFVYGDYTWGTLKDARARKHMDLYWKDLERQRGEYNSRKEILEAKAREVASSRRLVEVNTTQ